MISFTGLGSGLDIDAIVSGLVSAEGDAKTFLLSNKRSDIQTEISAFGNLKNIVTSLQTSTNILADASTFLKTSATSQDTSYFTVSSTTSATAGTYEIEIRTLAESQKLMSPGYTDSATNVGTGTLTISVGSDAFNVTIDSSNQTLAGIRDAINNASDNTGVTATLITVDDGVGGTLTKLVLTSDNTGTANALTVTVNDDDLTDTDSAGLSALYYDTGDATSPEQMTEINAAADAEFYIDGQKVLSSSNTVSSAIDGVTLNLLKAGTGVFNDLTVSHDTQSVKDAINVFVSNYNSFMSFTKNLTVYDADTGTAGILLGDATLRTLSNSVRANISQSVTGITGPYLNLVDLGITTSSTGTLVIDDTKLDAALADNESDVASFFSSTDGLATRLGSTLNEYTKSEGILDNKTSGLNETINDIDADLADLSLQLTALEERLYAQYSALDLIVSELNSTSEFLTQQFEQIAKINSKK